MKYKCVNCGHVFEAESSTTNNCPVCGSINVAVQPASNKPYLILLGVFCALIIVCLVILFLPSKDKTAEPIAYDADSQNVETLTPGEDTDIKGVVIDPNPALPDNQTPTPNTPQGPMKIENIKVVKAPEYNSANKTWSFSVEAQLNNGAQGAPIIYEVIDSKGKRITSTNGQFRNISVASTSIPVLAKLKDNESVKSFVDVNGFVVKPSQETTVQSGEGKSLVTKADVQGWINNLRRKPNPLLDTKGNTKVSRDLHITLTGLNEEDSSRGLQHPRADKLQEKVEFGEWESFTVESIECDPKTGVLKSVTARVHYPAD